MDEDGTYKRTNAGRVDVDGTSARAVDETFRAFVESRRRALDSLAPDVERNADGFSIAVFYRPSLLRAAETGARATVEIRRRGAPVALDIVDVDAANAFDVFTHPAVYSSAYADALTRQDERTE